MKNKKIFVKVAKDYEGYRLDIYLSLCLKGYSRSFITKMINEGCVHINGISRKPGYNISVGDLVIVFFSLKKVIRKSYIPTLLEVIYEDSDIMVVNKKPGIIVHPSQGNSYSAISDILHCYNPSFSFMQPSKHRYGVVHRLDKDTSGVLIISKNIDSYFNISHQFKHNIVTKKYLSIVYGVPSSKNGIINMPIGKHFINKKVISTSTKKHRSAKTLWKILRTYKDIASFLEITTKTGRTHQIRAHCKMMGNPIIGDQMYKCRNIFRFVKNEKKITNLLKSTKRQMLHANMIKIKHPKNEKSVIFEANLSFDIIRFLNKLNKLNHTSKSKKY